MQEHMFMFLTCWFLSLRGCLCQGKYFIIEDRNTSTLQKLTTATKDGDSYRYPCYISVAAYKDPTLTAPVTNAAVSAVTTERLDHTKYFGYSTERTDANGHTCVLTLCRQRAVLFVENGAETNLERLYAVKQSDQKVPVGYTFNITTRFEEITLNVRNWGSVFGKTGPVYNLDEKDTCFQAGTSNYYFAFSFISLPENLTTAIGKEIHQQPKSWYYAYDLTPEFQVCFMKIKVKTAKYQTKAALISYDADGNWLGTYTIGPKASPSTPDQATKAACLEFRCAVRDVSDKKMSTKVVGHIDGASCKMNWNRTALAGIQVNETDFSIIMQADDNYGARDGIYKADNRDLARTLCYTGQNDINQFSEENMNPETNYFVFFDCINPAVPVG